MIEGHAGISPACHGRDRELEVKRNFGARILSRKDSTRSVETVLFVICHNIRRRCQTGIIDLEAL